jgi:outer membrane protein W
MKRRYRKIWRILLLVTYLSIFFFVPQAYAQRFQVSIFGGWNHVFEYGSEDDYVLGENDFPVTPAHSPILFGAGLAFSLTDNIGVELDGRYVFSSKVTLVDPSDQDTVAIDTAKHYSITLNVIYRFLKGRFRPYVLLGGGIDKLLAKEEIHTSEYGFQIEFLPPEKTTDTVANIAAGFQYFLRSRLGARLDLRYSIIFDDPDNQNSLSLALGLFYVF